MHVVRANEHHVFVMYEYDLKAGGTHRNVELITVVDNLITEVQVFFGGTGALIAACSNAPRRQAAV